MKIDPKKLGEFIEEYIRPLWEEQDPDNPYRDGGGEAYLHDKVLSKAQPLMNLESIKKDPKGSLHGSLKAHDNLLSQFEWSRAKDFLQNISDEELLKHLLRLFDESKHLSERLSVYQECTAAVSGVGSGRIIHVTIFPSHPSFPDIFPKIQIPGHSREVFNVGPQPIS